MTYKLEKTNQNCSKIKDERFNQWELIYQLTQTWKKELCFYLCAVIDFRDKSQEKKYQRTSFSFFN